MPLHPTVLWAQRANLLFLTVEISDIKVSLCWYEYISLSLKNSFIGTQG